MYERVAAALTNQLEWGNGMAGGGSLMGSQFINKHVALSYISFIVLMFMLLCSSSRVIIILRMIIVRGNWGKYSNQMVENNHDIEYIP